MLLSFHVQLLTHMAHEQNLYFIAYKLVSLFSMESLYTRSFEYLNKVDIRATVDSNLGVGGEGNRQL